MDPSERAAGDIKDLPRSNVLMRARLFEQKVREAGSTSPLPPIQPRTKLLRHSFEEENAVDNTDDNAGSFERDSSRQSLRYTCKTRPKLPVRIPSCFLGKQEKESIETPVSKLSLELGGNNKENSPLRLPREPPKQHPSPIETVKPSSPPRTPPPVVSVQHRALQFDSPKTPIDKTMRTIVEEDEEPELPSVSEASHEVVKDISLEDRSPKAASEAVGRSSSPEATNENAFEAGNEVVACDSSFIEAEKEDIVPDLSTEGVKENPLEFPDLNISSSEAANDDFDRNSLIEATNKAVESFLSKDFSFEMSSEVANENAAEHKQACSGFSPVGTENEAVVESVLKDEDSFEDTYAATANEAQVENEVVNENSLEAVNEEKDVVHSPEILSAEAVSDFVAYDSLITKHEDIPPEGINDDKENRGLHGEGVSSPIKADNDESINSDTLNGSSIEGGNDDNADGEKNEPVAGKKKGGNQQKNKKKGGGKGNKKRGK